MSQYSVVAWTEHEVMLVDPDLLLEPGTNAFTVFTDDMAELLRRLTASNVRIYGVKCIEAPPAPPIIGQ